MKTASLASRRSGGETLDTGIEIFPSGSRIAPGGNPVVGGGGVVVGGGAVLSTCVVALDVAVVMPSVFRAVTCTRSRCPTSAEAATYCVPVAPEIAAQS